jgi:hypothetical protein
MTPREADHAIREAARAFANGEVPVQKMWGEFYSHLQDLCAERPMSRELLALFEALESWEVSVGEGRSNALGRAQDIAHRLGDQPGMTSI